MSVADSGFTSVRSADLSPDDTYKLLIGCVQPRPVAWITTVGRTGVVNAAPFSSYNYIGSQPPTLAINIVQRGDGGLKDTARNILDTREFTVNVVNEAQLEVMYKTGEDFPPEMSEPETFGIALLPGVAVAVPRIAESPVQMECHLTHMLTIGNGHNVLYLGEVVAFHLSNAVYANGKIDSERLRPVARLGGPFYTGLGKIWHFPPSAKGR